MVLVSFSFCFSWLNVNFKYFSYSWRSLFAVNSNFSYYWGQFGVDVANNVVIRNCSIVRDLRDQVTNMIIINIYLKKR